MRLLAVLLLLMIFAPETFAATGGKGAGSHSSMPGSGSSAAGSGAVRSGGGSARRLDPRNVPPLAADRKVNEQDCSKPIDWTAGNLKCK